MSENIIYTVLALNSCIGFKYVGGVNCCQTEYGTEKQPPPPPPPQKNPGSQICCVATVFGRHTQLIMEDLWRNLCASTEIPCICDNWNAHMCVCVRLVEFEHPNISRVQWKHLHSLLWWPIHTCVFVVWRLPLLRACLHVWIVTVGLPNVCYFLKNLLVYQEPLHTRFFGGR